jgi:hypothetical protein
MTTVASARECNLSETREGQACAGWRKGVKGRRREGREKEKRVYI